MASEGPSDAGAVPWGAARSAEEASAGQVAPAPAEKKKWKEKLGLKGKGKKGKAAGKAADAEAPPPPPDLAGEGSNGQGDREKDIGKLMEAMTRTVRAPGGAVQKARCFCPSLGLLTSSLI